MLLLKLEQATGIDVEVRYGDTSELVTLMLTEADQSPADIIFTQDSGHLGALANQDRLATLDGECDPAWGELDVELKDQKLVGSIELAHGDESEFIARRWDTDTDGEP